MSRTNQRGVIPSADRKTIATIRLLRKNKHKPCLICSLRPWYECSKCSFRLCKSCRTKRWKTRLTQQGFDSEKVPDYRCMGDVWEHFAATDCKDAATTITISEYES